MSRSSIIYLHNLSTNIGCLVAISQSFAGISVPSFIFKIPLTSVLNLVERFKKAQGVKNVRTSG
jgi:hypothetical protein